jgi:site-specific recombinase XerD
MTTHEAIDVYLDYLRVERGLSSATISAYRSDLLGFASFVESGGFDDWQRDPRAARDSRSRSGDRRSLPAGDSPA